MWLIGLTVLHRWWRQASCQTTQAHWSCGTCMMHVTNSLGFSLCAILCLQRSCGPIKINKNTYLSYSFTVFFSHEIKYPTQPATWGLVWFGWQHAPPSAMSISPPLHLAAQAQCSKFWTQCEEVTFAICIYQLLSRINTVLLKAEKNVSEISTWEPKCSPKGQNPPRCRKK
jgi:hypothetical protein